MPEFAGQFSTSFAADIPTVNDTLARFDPRGL
jgi:hypothetical protein